MLIDPNSKLQEVTLSAEESRPGWFSGQCRLQEPGIHRLELVIPGTQEKLVKAITGTAPNLEFEDPRRNDALLEALAKKTGGDVFTLDQLASLAETIPDRSEVEILSGVPETLWDRPWVLVLAVTLLSIEWILRKRYNLA
jgi:hypothetical protein